MAEKKNKLITNPINSIDFYHFNNIDTHLPGLDLINERFARCFRVSISNHLKMITNIKYDSNKISFQKWMEQEKTDSCMFVVKLKSLTSNIIIKLNPPLAYGILDILMGGNGQDYLQSSNKEMTKLELTLLQDIATLVIKDLNISWDVLHDIQAEYVRTEVNAKFLGAITADSKVISTNFNLEFNSIKGLLEIVYPNSALFPIRDKLFNAFR